MRNNNPAELTEVYSISSAAVSHISRWVPAPVASPTSGAVKYHSCQPYLQVQQWFGNDKICHTNWGWCSLDDRFVPIEMNAEVAPERVLQMLTRGCKTVCIWNCKCKNAGLKYINRSPCGGRTCNDSDLNADVVGVQPFPILHAWNVAALVDFNSFSESHIHTQSFTPLPWGGGHHHDT